MGCIGSTITNRRRHSTSPRKPKPFWQCVLSCGRWIPVVWGNSSPCYPFRGAYRDSQDVTIGRTVAKFCKQPYEVIHVGKEFLSRFPHYAERSVHLTDGCVEVSRAPVLYANERAAEIAPVRMTGNYGSEVLRTVRAFKPVKPTPGLFRPEVLPQIDAASETYAGLTQTHP